MGAHKHSGFTIIEVMLFLAITGLLVAGIMIGASRNIENQRYRDTVEQVRNTIQGEFDRVYSLTNSNAGEHGNENPCIESGAENFRPRGTTDCLYVGRIIQVTGDATDGTSSLRSSPLIARPLSGEIPLYFGSSGASASEATGGANVDPVDGYTVFRYDSNEALVDTWTLGWGLGLFGANENSNRLAELSILILRSPVNGAISTHVVDGEMTDETAQDVTEHIRSDESRKDASMCVGDIHREVDAVKRMAVIVRAGAAGPGAVETVGDASGCSA